jgi:hypothetical protein
LPCASPLAPSPHVLWSYKRAHARRLMSSNMMSSNNTPSIRHQNQRTRPLNRTPQIKVYSDSRHTKQVYFAQTLPVGSYVQARILDVHGFDLVADLADPEEAAVFLPHPSPSAPVRTLSLSPPAPHPLRDSRPHPLPASLAPPCGHCLCLQLCLHCLCLQLCLQAAPLHPLCLFMLVYPFLSSMLYRTVDTACCTAWWHAV